MRILETLSWPEIGAAIGGEAVGAARTAARGASIDTRTLEPGDIFFALRGERVDGHRHVGEAFARGAAASIVRDRSALPPDSFGFVVSPWVVTWATGGAVDRHRRLLGA